MTISYAGNFGRLLLRWKGSIWKSVWKELLAFLVIFYAIRLVYFFALTPDQQKTFEYVSQMCDGYTKNIPLTFLLGFYVSNIVRRWWDQFSYIPYPDNVLCLVDQMIPPGSCEQADLKRHNIARWLCLTAALVYRDISVKIRKRFPTIEHLIAVDLMTENEFALYKANVRTVLAHSPPRQGDGDPEAIPDNRAPHRRGSHDRERIRPLQS